MNTQYAIIPGSLSAVSQSTGKSIAETFISCDVVILVDTSGSMACNDSTDGMSRYEKACQELSSLQKSMAGKIGVIAFSGSVEFCPNGIATYLGGGTDLTRALQFTRVADVPGIRFILISDGDPHDRNSALAVSRQYKNHIDAIYVGLESNPSGRDFLQQLASLTGGKTVTADRAKELQSSIQQLLLR